jgi:DNA polymerase-3 subunit beta
MNILVDQKPLVSLLSQAQTVVEKKTNSTQLMNVYLKAQNNTLTVYATDLEVSLVGEISCETKQEGTAAVSAKTFYDVTRELNDSKIHLIRQDNHWLDIRQDRFHSKIIGIPPEEYPLFALQQPNEWTEVSGAQFKSLIQQTDYAISNDISRAYLTGIYFENINGQYTMVATDGHRLAIATQKCHSTQDSMFKNGIIIPKKGISEIKKLIEDNSENFIKIATDSTQFYIQKPGITLGIRLVEAKFPPFKKLIPSNKFLATINKSQMMTAVKRVALFSSSKSRAISLHFSKDVLEINTTSFELGDAADELSLNYDGPKMKITYNSKYLLDVLANIQENEVEFQIESGEKATLIQGKGNPNFINIVMPMRI